MDFRSEPILEDVGKDLGQARLVGVFLSFLAHAPLVELRFAGSPVKLWQDFQSGMFAPILTRVSIDGVASPHFLPHAPLIKLTSALHFCLDRCRSWHGLSVVVNLLQWMDFLKTDATVVQEGAGDAKHNHKVQVVATGSLLGWVQVVSFYNRAARDPVL